MSENPPIIPDGTTVTSGQLWNAINGCYHDGDATSNDLLHGTMPLLLEMKLTPPLGSHQCLLMRAGIRIASLTVDVDGKRPLLLRARPGYIPPTKDEPHDTPFLYEDLLVPGPVWLSKFIYAPDTAEQLKLHPELTYAEVDRILEVWREEITRGLRALTGS
jgi:hypothetical protein